LRAIVSLNIAARNDERIASGCHANFERQCTAPASKKKVIPEDKKFEGKS
jgi:hypothetical protein